MVIYKKKLLFIYLIAFFLIGQTLFSSSLFLSSAQATSDFKINLWKTADKAGYDVAGTGKEVEFFATTAGKAIALFLSLLGAIFLVLMIYAGFRWMLAQGNEQEVVYAKKTIKNAAIGLVVVIAAFALTVFIGNIIDLAPEAETNS